MVRSDAVDFVTVRCPSCSERSSVQLSPADIRPTCPHCERPLVLDRPLNVAQEDFRATVIEAGVPVLVDFHADWCAPCQWLVPVLEELAGKWRGRILVAKVDTDRAPDVASDCGIRSVPTVILFSGGEEVGRSVGVEPEVLNELLEDVA